MRLETVVSIVAGIVGILATIVVAVHYFDGLDYRIRQLEGTVGKLNTQVHVVTAASTLTSQAGTTVANPIPTECIDLANKAISSASDINALSEIHAQQGSLGCQYLNLKPNNAKP
jgi:hypothetical protein